LRSAGTASGTAVAIFIKGGKGTLPSPEPRSEDKEKNLITGLENILTSGEKKAVPVRALQ
jgi:hypothetical protein